MSYSFDDIFNFVAGTPTKDNYTLEEIEAAKKRQNKYGGTFMENLAKIAPDKAKSKASSAISNAMSTSDLTANIKSLNESLAKDFGNINADIQKLNNQKLEKLVSDEDMKKEAILNEINSKAVTNTSVQTSAQEDKVLTDPVAILDKFKGLNDALKQKVFGQDDFIKKLTIAFKRPYVSELDENDAMNSIFITGPVCTGKHYALSTIVDELKNRNVFESNEICTIDLSLYPSSTEEKLFLQDLYAALQSTSSVIVFENIENCHISMLTRLSDLVTTGECKLSERYVMQQGQLVSVANAFAGNTIGSFEAKGKYLVFVSNKSLDKLAGVMGATFVNSLGDVCAASSLSEDAMKKISEEREKQLVEKCKKQLGYDITLEDSFKEYILNQTSKGRELNGILDTYMDTLKALTELRLERDDLDTSELVLACNDTEPVIKAGDEEIAVISLLPGGYNGELDSVKAEMDKIIGLKSVKEYIYSLEEYFGVQKRRREAGLKAGEVNKHMIFTGNPGTGKTTIARIVSKYLKAIGVLSGGQLVEVSRADLVGRYVGHTAPLVNQVIKSAIGGVLFIDEAYSLNRGEDDSFGLEAIDTLVKGIEDNRDDLIVILAGYSKEMSEFLETNSGLKSRFPNIIDFPDYTGEELLEIAKLTAKSKGYEIDEDAYQPLLEYFNLVQATRAFDAGNGRLVRNKIEAAILNQSRRLVVEKDADMSLLLEKDFDLED